MYSLDFKAAVPQLLFSQKVLVFLSNCDHFSYKLKEKVLIGFSWMLSISILIWSSNSILNQRFEPYFNWFLCSNAFFSLFPVSCPSLLSWLTCMHPVFSLSLSVCEARPLDHSVPCFINFDPDEQIQMQRSNSMGLLCKSVAEDLDWFMLDLLFLSCYLVLCKLKIRCSPL